MGDVKLLERGASENEGVIPNPTVHMGACLVRGASYPHFHCLVSATQCTLTQKWISILFSWRSTTNKSHGGMPK